MSIHDWITAGLVVALTLYSCVLVFRRQRDFKITRTALVGDASVTVTVEGFSVQEAVRAMALIWASK